MTRSYKTQHQDQENLPRTFGKSSGTAADPHKTKKNGGGRGNWGCEGDEVIDSNANMVKTRRRSNCSAHTASLANFKSKFEEVEDEPVFIDRIHGVQPGDIAENAEGENGAVLEKTETVSSADEEVETDQVKMKEE